MADKDKRSKPEETEDQASINISVGGDVSGSVTGVGGDYIAGDKVIQGDEVHGDKIEVGDIVGSTGVAIGHNSSVTVDQSTTNITINPFEEARKQLEKKERTELERDAVEGYIKELEEHAQEAQPEQDAVDKNLEKLEKYAPDVVEVLINAFLNPGAAVGKGIQTAIHIWRDGRKNS